MTKRSLSSPSSPHIPFLKCIMHYRFLHFQPTNIFYLQCPYSFWYCMHLIDFLTSHASSGQLILLHLTYLRPLLVHHYTCYNFFAKNFEGHFPKPCCFRIFNQYKYVFRRLTILFFKLIVFLKTKRLPNSNKNLNSKLFC